MAETIENNIRKVIIDEQPVNPKYYEEMSQVLDALIKERREGALEYKAYLEKSMDLARKVKKPGFDSSKYSSSVNTPAKRSLCDNLDGDEQQALAVDEAVRMTKKANFVGHRMKEKEIENAVREVLDVKYHTKLDVVSDPGSQRVEIKNRGRITMFLHEGTDVSTRHRIMTEWYRQQLKEMIPPLVEKWQLKIGTEIDDWQVKIMRTRWGSCNQSARRIWLNLELAKKPVECLEYVIVHEILHLQERQHNDNFVAFMDLYLPKWRLYKAELNKLPVRHEEWKY